MSKWEHDKTIPKTREWNFFVNDRKYVTKSKIESWLLFKEHTTINYIRQDVHWVCPWSLGSLQLWYQIFISIKNCFLLFTTSKFILLVDWNSSVGLKDEDICNKYWIIYQNQKGHQEEYYETRKSLRPPIGSQDQICDLLLEFMLSSSQFYLNTSGFIHWGSSQSANISTFWRTVKYLVTLIYLM